MTIKNSGNPLSFSEIEDEFGSTPGRKLGSYRNSHSDFKNENCGALTDLPLDTGIPKTGEIKFSDFYGKKLNMVVDYFDDTGNSGGTTPNILNREDNGNNTMAASWRYNNQPARVRVVGGYRSRPTGSLSGYQLSSTSWQGGKKVFIHVNKFVGGKKSGVDDNTKNRVALRTGTWPSNTTLQIDIGSSGRLQGAGGMGGKGGFLKPQKGRVGTSALGVEYPAQINNNGIIRCGYGGGGGGGGSSSNPNKSKVDFGRAGGGGGGGAGIPVGLGGAGNKGGYDGKNAVLNDPSKVGFPGKDGTFNAGGNHQPHTGPVGPGGVHDGFGVGPDHGGASKNSNPHVKAGNGGNGADINDPTATKGKDGVRQGGGTDQEDGAPAGSNGYGIIFTNSSVQSNSTGDKTIPTNEGGVHVGTIL